MRNLKGPCGHSNPDNWLGDCFKAQDIIDTRASMPVGADMIKSASIAALDGYEKWALQTL